MHLENWNSYTAKCAFFHQTLSIMLQNFINLGYNRIRAREIEQGNKERRYYNEMIVVTFKIAFCIGNLSKLPYRFFIVFLIVSFIGIIFLLYLCKWHRVLHIMLCWVFKILTFYFLTALLIAILFLFCLIFWTSMDNYL